MKNAGTVLLYNCSAPEFSKLKQIFAMLRLRMRVVEPDRYHVPLEELAQAAQRALQGGAGAEAQEAFRNIISAYAKDRLVLLSTHIVSDVEHIAAQIMMMEYGDIQHIHTGGEYVQMMEGRVWLGSMPAEELVDYQNRAVISNVKAKDGRMEIRIIEDTQPVPGAVQTVPTLEDAYLYLFNYLPGKAGR